jgi:hypothetical protein
MGGQLIGQTGRKIFCASLGCCTNSRIPRVVRYGGTNPRRPAQLNLIFRNFSVVNSA